MKTSDPLRVLLVVALLSATGLVVLLGFEVRSLRTEVREATDREMYLSPGLYVPELELELPDGSSVTIGSPPAGESEVLFIYNTTCSFCSRAVQSWSQLATTLEEIGILAYGVSLDTAEETVRFAESHQLNFPSLLLEDRRSAAFLRAVAVPQTLLLDSEGKVLFSRRGALSASAVDSLLTLADSTALRSGG